MRGDKKLVTQVRSITGCGIMTAAKALFDMNRDLNKAIELVNTTRNIRIKW